MQNDGLTQGIGRNEVYRTRRQITAAQAVVHHGRSARGVDEFGQFALPYINPGRFDQFWTQMARKAETIDVDGYLEEKTAMDAIR